MSVQLGNQKLVYQGVDVQLRFGPVRMAIPEWLVLGHTRIVEQANDDGSFSMDFSLTHPWFGQVYRYAGRFRTYAE